MSNPFITITISSASGRLLARVDHEGAVHAPGDVLGQRRDVAVVQVQAERLGLELVGDRLARGDDAGADTRHAVHLGGMDPVEVDRVRMLGPVAEPDPKPLALARPQRRRRDAAVVGPGRELDARRDLDLLVDGDQLPLAQRPPAGKAPGAPVVEVAQDLCGVEAVGGIVHLPTGLERRVGGHRPCPLPRTRATVLVLLRMCGSRRPEVHAAKPRNGTGPQGRGQRGKHASAAQAVHGTG